MNKYTIYRDNLDCLSERQSRKLARFKAARACLVNGKVVVVLDERGLFV